MRFSHSISLLTVVASLVLSARVASAEDAPATAFPGMEADLAATVKRESSFYVIKTIADLPKDLKWENGSDLPEFGDPAAKKGGTFTFYLQDFPRTIRTIGPESTGGMRQYLLDYVEVPITFEHPNLPGKNLPGLAKEWAVVRSERTIYYRLHETATWSDGKPITTDDLVFTFYFMRSGHHREPWSSEFYATTWEKITVYDARTFSLTMKELRPDFEIRNGNFTLYPRHAMADFGPDYVEKFQWQILPFSGAYMLKPEDLDKGRSVTLTRVKDWWARDLPFWRYRYNPDRYRFQIIRDHDKALESFMRGDIDYFQQSTAVPKYWYEILANDNPLITDGYVHKAFFFNRVPRPGWGLWINCTKHLLDNKDVRWGIQYASNFDLVARQFHRGDAVQMSTFNDGYSWRVHPTITARKFDPVKAREYFAKAGFTTQGPDGVLVNDNGERLSFSVTTYRPDIRDIMTILKTEAIKAGLELRLEVLDQSTGWKKTQEKQHEIAMIAYSKTPELYPRYFDFLHGSNAYDDAYIDANGKFVDKAEKGTPNPHPKKVRVTTNNVFEIFNPELDKLIEAFEVSESLDEVKQLSERIEEIVYDQAVWVPGWTQPYYRVAYWRWVKWPKNFNVALSRYADEYFVHWIDQDVEQETRAARKSGKTFLPAVTVFDEFKEPGFESMQPESIPPR